MARLPQPFNHAPTESPLEIGKASMSIADAWHRLGLLGTPGKSCKSPFREDRRPSFSIYNSGRRWKDQATDAGGDICDFIQAALNVTASEAAKWLIEQTSARTSRRKWPQAVTVAKTQKQSPEKRESLKLPTLDLGTIAELAQLQWQRELPYFAGLQILIDRGQLAFATLKDGSEKPRCWIVTDDSKRNAQARRLDGKPWKSLPGNPKSKTLKGSQARWPIGASRILKTNTVLFCEGAPDLLAAATFAAFELSEWEAVTMPGASLNIHTEALPLFKGKQVYLFMHNDDPGLAAARKWSRQLTEAGASVTALCSDVEGRDLNDSLTAKERISLT